MKSDIKLHNNSTKYLENVFSQYKETKQITSETVVKNPVVHMYATRDTYNEYGEQTGYTDSLFFNAVIYDTVSMIKYETTSEHDSVSFYDTSPHTVKIFKDGSTLLGFYGEHVFLTLTSLCVFGTEN